MLGIRRKSLFSKKIQKDKKKKKKKIVKIMS